MDPPQNEPSWNAPEEFQKRSSRHDTLSRAHLPEMCRRGRNANGQARGETGQASMTIAALKAEGGSHL